MKNYSFLILFFMICTYASGQNTGIGTTTPSEKLEVNGAIKLGSTNQNNSGTIQWDGSDFKGYDGNDWKNLGETLPTGSLIMSQNINNEFLNNGFSHFGKMEQQMTDLDQAAAGWQTDDGYDASNYIPLWQHTSHDTLYILTRDYSSDEIILNIYDNNTQSWTIANMNLTIPYRDDFAIDISEDYIIFWGGGNYNDGYIYQIDKDKWVAIDVTGAPGAKKNAILTIIGNKFYMYGGETNSAFINKINEYDFNGSSPSWSSLPTSSAMANLDPIWYANNHFQIQNGWLIYVNSDSVNPSMHYFKFSTNTWTTINMTDGPPSQMIGKPYLFGDDLVIWCASTIPHNKGYVFDFSAFAWSLMSETNNPPEVVFLNNIIFNDKIYMFGSLDLNNNSVDTLAYIYDKTNDIWNTMSMTNGPQGFISGFSTLFNDKIFIYGGGDTNFAYTNSGALYDIAQDSWTTYINKSEPKEYLFIEFLYQQVHSFSDRVMIFFPQYFENGSNFGSGESYIWCEACLNNVSMLLHLYIKN
ncbi:hypothetical protein N9231_02500 [Saprospiraceae bacterium]|nr:hypothetical protein [Saprospiraceae bacterium]